jgi:hypothetical protein
MGVGMDASFKDDKIGASADGSHRQPRIGYGQAIDVKGTIRDMVFAYHGEGDDLIGSIFGDLSPCMGKVEKTDANRQYHDMVGHGVHRFTIRYVKQHGGAWRSMADATRSPPQVLSSLR